MNQYVFADGKTKTVKYGIPNDELTKLVREHGPCEIKVLGLFDKPDMSKELATAPIGAVA